MSSCDISITIKRGDRTFKPGEILEGLVEVMVNKNVTCKALTIEIGWQAHGIGNTYWETIDQRIVSNLNWISGSSFTYTFEFRVPKKPLTYHGHHLNVDHYIKARADIPWALDPQKMEDFIVIPGPGSNQDYQLEEPEPEPRLEKKKTSIFGYIFGYLILAVILGMIIFFFIAFWWLIALIVTGFIIRKIMLYMAAKRLGDVSLEVNPTMVTPGDTVNLNLSFSPAKRIKLNQVTVKFSGQEICTSGSGTTSKTHRHSLHHEEMTLASDYEISGGSPVFLSGKLKVPAISAYSLDVKDNKLKWEVDVHVDIPRYPDWKKSVTLTLIPDNA